MYQASRNDILPTLPSTVYAGMVYNISIEVSQPTNMLRVDLDCSDPFISFQPDKIYFNSYDSSSITVQLVVSSMASNNS